MAQRAKPSRTSSRRSSPVPPATVKRKVVKPSRPATPVAKTASRVVRATKPLIVKTVAVKPVRVEVKTVKPPVSQIAKAVAAISGTSPGMTRAMKFLTTLADYEKLRIVRYNTDNFDLNRMRSLLKKLGNPQDHLRCVHIAGTKGKGSTTAMTAAMLQAQGLKVGVYTSPHLVDIRERIKINDTLIGEDEFAKLMRQIEPIVRKMKPLPTYFDVLTAMAFKYFVDQKVDIAVIETGLGGRLDSTNVCKPEVTAITTLSFDHMQQLGYSLSLIAAEKAGIFKPGVPALSVVQAPEAEAALKRVANEVGTTLDVCGTSIEFSYRFEASRIGGRRFRVCLTTPNSKFEHLTVPLLGEHQAINCGLALSIIDRLKSRGFPIDDQKAMEGLEKTRIIGRMEIIKETPRILIDAAHNAASVDAFIRAVGQHVPYDSMVVVFGCCADKDVTPMLDRIAAGADKVIFTKVDNIRSANPHELAARYIEEHGKMAQVAETLEEAMEIAYRAVTKEDLICITGSFYLIGEARRKLAANLPAPLPSLVSIE